MHSFGWINIQEPRKRHSLSEVPVPGCWAQTLFLSGYAVAGRRVHLLIYHLMLCVMLFLTKVV
jgi:hypothetical protein